MIKYFIVVSAKLIKKLAIFSIFALNFPNTSQFFDFICMSSGKFSHAMHVIR